MYLILCNGIEVIVIAKVELKFSTKINESNYNFSKRLLNFCWYNVTRYEAFDNQNLSI